MNKFVNYNDKWYLLVESGDEVELVEPNKERSYHVNEKTENTRSALQNASLHKLFSMWSKSLNDGGFSIQRVVALFKKAEIMWTMLSVKDIIWRNMQVALTGKESTTKLTTEEVTKVYKVTDNYLSTKVGIDSIPFPSIDSMIMDKKLKDN